MAKRRCHIQLRRESWRRPARRRSWSRQPPQRPTCTRGKVGTIAHARSVPLLPAHARAPYGPPTTPRPFAYVQGIPMEWIYAPTPGLERRRRRVRYPALLQQLLANKILSVAVPSSPKTSILIAGVNDVMCCASKIRLIVR